MKKKIVSRIATKEDLPEIHQLFQATIQYCCNQDYDEAQIAVWISSVENKSRWIKAIESQFFIVAKEGHHIVGFASLADVNYIDFIYVHEDHQRKGIASFLFDILQEEAKKQGQTTLWSHVSKTARPFFERKGFEVLQENYKDMRGVIIMNYWMRKCETASIQK
ncbi:MAG: GNAT family N-acetyltransferase [Bacteroidota bacterium]